MTEKKTPYHRPGLREALVSAGRTLLEEKGLRGFTLRECARRAEVSHAAPAHHFASINDLLAEIAARTAVAVAIEALVIIQIRLLSVQKKSLEARPSWSDQHTIKCK